MFIDILLSSSFFEMIYRYGNLPPHKTEIKRFVLWTVGSISAS